MHSKNIETKLYSSYSLTTRACGIDKQIKIKNTNKNKIRK